ncbi:hypothetical protein BDY24DRAFT_371574 [Mrakia frigida]|uniref:uncharacterized protein n=1 Tax=Mrakia frigida TaxID=29902 RepID=UPI003FCC1A22
MVWPATNRRKLGREIHMPNLFYRPSEEDPTQMVLSVPRFSFSAPYLWNETGSSTVLAVGTSLEDGSHVLAKIAKNGSLGAVVVERETHILSCLGNNLEASGKTMRIVDYFVIPPGQGDAVVLILKHPGRNLLSTFFPSSDQSIFLCSLDPTSHGEDIAMSKEEMAMIPREVDRSPAPSRPSEMVVDEIEEKDENGDLDMEGRVREEEAEEVDESHTEIDIASFLEFAVQAAHCIEILHTHNITHREIRPNAFHWNSSSGIVRWAHFGNRSVSLEGLGGPSNLVVEAESLGELERKRVTDALSYLAPEQTGRVQYSSDHRTDLYALGVTLFTILTGSVPFSGTAVDVFQAIVTLPPPKVHELRPDVPRVVSAIISKLLEKDPDNRYRSPVGLKADLVHCQFKLTEGWNDGRLNGAGTSSELVPFFTIAEHDKFSEFTLPNTLFGRTSELEIIKAVLKRVSTTHSLHYSGGRRSILPNSSNGGQTQSGSMTGTPFNQPTAADSISSIGSSRPSNSPSNENGGRAPAASLLSFPLSRLSRGDDIAEERSITSSGGGKVGGSSGSGGRIRTHGNAKERLASARAIVISGAGGVGKSSLVLECQTVVRAAGFYGLAKFDATETSPYSAILTCLSFVFRQLLTEFQSDVASFFTTLKARLGPQLNNVQLLYHSIPEIKELMRMFGLTKLPNIENLPTQASTARFHNLIIDCIATLAQIKMLTMWFDDLHWADEPSLALIRSLAAAKVRMLIITTLRPESETFVTRVQDIFGTGARATYINLEPLDVEATADLVSAAIHQPAQVSSSPRPPSLDDTEASLRFPGHNALRQRHLSRHNNLYFDWADNVWRYNLTSIENDFFPEVAASTDEGDVEFLVSHLNDLSYDVQRFLLWAALFGGVFRIRDIIALLDSEETSGDDSEDEQQMRLSRGSMNGLQTALAEGWIINRGRDMCAFTHDRYRQAAFNLGERLPAEEIQGMALKIVDVLLSEENPDFYQVAEHVRKCIPLLLTQKNTKYQRILRQAGENALEQGAHEMALRYFEACKQLMAESWEEDLVQAFELRLCVAELLTWKGDVKTSESAMEDLLQQYHLPMERAAIYRADSRNKWTDSNPSGQLDLLLKGLELRSTSHRGVEERNRQSSRLACNNGSPQRSGRFDPFRSIYGRLLGYWRWVARYDWIEARRPRSSGRNEPFLLARFRLFSLAAGDRQYSSFGLLHHLSAKLTANLHLSDTLLFCEEVLEDVVDWASGTGTVYMVQGTGGCIKALAGKTVNTSPETVLDDEDFTDSRDCPSDLPPVPRHWFDSFKIVALFSLGWYEAAADLGFDTWKTKFWNPNHYHARLGVYYHSLALLRCLREGRPPGTATKYREQISLNQAFLSRWLETGSINFKQWTTLVDAELASLDGETALAFKLYDLALSHAQDGDWICDEGWILFLSGSNFVRCGVEVIGRELQARGITKQSQWGAFGVANYLTEKIGGVSSDPRLGSHMVEVGVQTDRTIMASVSTSRPTLISSDSNDTSNGPVVFEQLTVDDLTVDLWGRHAACYSVPCTTHDSRRLRIPSLPTTRRASCASPFLLTSSDFQIAKGLVLGAIYLTSGRTNAFSPSNVAVLTLLAQQSSISITNARLFRKLQRATQANIRMIDQQKKALEEARRSREEALKATKIKSNFLASMSHELRTPFSSFYGLLGLLSETDLNQEQREFVSTAQQSCELLLEIIDSLLDYSKLEAGAVKLEVIAFNPEEILADCCELLMVQAAKKGLQLSYDVSPDVPLLVSSDPSRLRQIIMNILGNSLKFTASGYVTARCSLDTSGTVECHKGEIALLFEIEDTGIGLSSEERALLFLPFSQMNEEAASLRQQLLTPRPPWILIVSSSPATISFASSILQGCVIVDVGSVEAAQVALASSGVFSPRFVLLDFQADDDLQKIRSMTQRLPNPPKIVHLFVPTLETIKNALVDSSKRDVFRSNHPIRRRRLVQLLIDLKSGGSGEDSKDSGLPSSAPAPIRTIDRFTDDEKTLFLSAKILIAEDNPVASKLLIKTLERLSLQVHATTNGEEAVEEWDAHPSDFFSLLLFDSHMPLRDGPSAAARIRLLESKRGVVDRVPIVGLSADCQQSARLLSLSSGMQDYLSKPLRSGDLVKLLREYVLPRFKPSSSLENGTSSATDLTP